MAKATTKAAKVPTIVSMETPVELQQVFKVTEGMKEDEVSRADALRWQVDGELPDTSIGEALSDSSQPTAYLHSPIGEVDDLMVESGVGRIPIVEVGTNRVVGILSRHDLLKVRSARKRAEIDRT